jgi:Uma2 family endonuclease
VADVKTRVESADTNYFPDVVLYCDDATFDPNRPDWLLTPLVIVEVLSPSTSTIDRTEKLDAYRSIESLRHYLLVDQKRVRIELIVARRKAGVTKFICAPRRNSPLRTW